MHVQILVTDVELCLNDLPNGESKINKPLNKKMVEFTLSEFPKGLFSTTIRKKGTKITFEVNRCYDIDQGLNLYNETNEHILFVSGGVDVKQIASLASICAQILERPNALAIGNIYYSKDKWFRIKQNLVYINIDNWKKAGQPWFGSWQNFTYVSDDEYSYLMVSDDENIGLNLSDFNFEGSNLFIIDRNLPVVDRSYDSEQILRINNTGKREDIKMTIRRAPGWNFIDVAYKNNLEIGSWPYEIAKKWPWLYNEEAGTFNDNS